MEPEPGGDYIGLVVRVQPAVDGTWQVYVDGTSAPLMVPLRPLTLLVRLRRSGETGLLRGTIELEGSAQTAPLHSNERLEQLIRSWLFSG